jgi:hypothetical protein
MEKSIDNEYLSRPLVNGVKYVINDNEISISSDNTIFTDIVNIGLDMSILKRSISNMRETKKLVKLSNGKITLKNTTKIIKFMKEHFSEFIAQVAVYHTLFEQAKEIAKGVQERGIHVGCVDDVELNRLNEVTSIMERMNYIGTPMSKFMAAFWTIKLNLENVKEEKKHNFRSDIRYFYNF